MGAGAAPPINALAAPPAISEPPVAAPPPAPPTSASGGHIPAFDVPPQSPAPASPPSYTPPSDPGPAYVTGPAAAPPPITTTAQPAGGPLPAYGADIRPTAATTPAVSTAPAGPPAAAPSPAPPSSGNIGQPAVVRHPGTPPLAATPAGVSGQAVAATATGAVAGQASADAAGRARLQHLVDTVARQEPVLAWAAGDRADGTTILVTDLAGGWIPPHIEIPAGMGLLSPARRRGGLEHLLGEVIATATYRPGQRLLSADDADPVAFSSRARHGHSVDELGWELSQATRWRDRLPRLAHTLATAVSRGTGVLDSEIGSLREHVGVIRHEVLGSYPDQLDKPAIENWQLLATIEALVSGEDGGANYHFAWFQASSRAEAEGQRS